MGTTLTGTKPKDTYDSLIKVTDNGPLSGTLKKLTDGLGNDSSLSLSTTAASLSGTLAVTGATTLTGALGGSSADFSGNARFTSAGNWMQFEANVLTSLNSDGAHIRSVVSAAANPTYAFAGDQDTGMFTSGANILGFSTAGVERMRVTANGLTFNGDTAAANALDDYEEGTWTMGVSFGGLSVGVTYSQNTGTYTKIGRQVTVNGLLQLTSKGSSTGSAKITGLPFTIANTHGNYSPPSLRFTNITFINQFQGYGDINTTTIPLEEITSLGVLSNLTDADFVNNSDILLSFTYFV